METSEIVTERKEIQTKPRLGFAGVGWIGQHRMEAIAKSEHAFIAAVADPADSLVDTALTIAPGAVGFNTFEDLLDADLDGIVIATPSALHANQAIRALEAGLAVFCQKPLGRDGAETMQVVEAARNEDRLLAVDLSYRFIRGVHEMRYLIQSGEIGKVYAADLTFHNAYGPGKSWFYDQTLSGGGCVIDLGIHLVDLALWVLQYPKVRTVHSRLFSKGQTLRDATSLVEDFAVAQLGLEDDTTLRLACSWNLPVGRDAIIEVSFYGTQGGLALQNINGSFYDFEVCRFKGTSREVLASPPDLWGGRAAVHWVARLAQDNRFDPEIESIIPVAKTLDLIYGKSQESIRNKTTVSHKIIGARQA